MKMIITLLALVAGGTAWAQGAGPGNVAAKDELVTVSVHVSAQGLDLTQRADAQTFYTRVKNAAWLVCGPGIRLNLLPTDYPTRCYERALGDAVRASNKPMVTQIYLASHTLQEAAAHGIDVSAQLAAK